MSRSTLIGMTVALFLSVVVVSGIHGSLLNSFLSLAVLSVLLLTVLPLTQMMFGNGIQAIVFAIPAGFLVHTLFLSLLAAVAGVRVWILVLYMVVAVLVALLRLRRGGAHQPEWDNKDIGLLLVWLLGCVWLTAPAFLNVGRQTEDGFAYRAYFNADFFRNLAVAGSLSKTGIPPENPYVSRETLHYYWMFHCFMAYWKSLFASYRADFLLVQLTLVVLCGFGAAMFAAVRTFVASRKAILLMLPILIVGGSYKSLLVIYYLRGEHLPLSRFVDINLEGILRWLWNAPQVDMLYRAFLYAPQHLLALTLLPMMLILWHNPPPWKGRLIAVLLEMISIGCSIFIGASVTFLSGSLVLLRALLRPSRNDWFELTFSLVLGTLFGVLFVKVFDIVQIGSGASLLRIGLPEPIHRYFFLYTILNWGSLLLFGFAGIVFGARRMTSLVLAVWLVASMLVLYMLQLRLPGGSDISLKEGYVVFTILLLLSAGALDRFVASRWKAFAFCAAGIIMLPAVLTWAMDLYNHQDIQNRKFTTYVLPEDMETLLWMKSHLPPDSVVQYYSSGSGYLGEYVTEVPAIAEHPVFLGDKNFTQIFQTPKEVLEKRTHDIWQLFNEESPANVYSICARLQIDNMILSARAKAASYDFRQVVVEPYFSVLHRNGDSIVFARNIHVTVNPQDVHTAVLFSEDGKAVIQATYSRNFYAREILEGMESSRWISNDAEIALESSRNIQGNLEFSALSLGKDREMELYLNDQLLLEQQVPRKRAHFLVPVNLISGQSKLRIHCPAGDEPADDYMHNGDHRRLSLRVFRLRFIS